MAYGCYAGYFDTFIISVIVLAGVMVGVQTYPEFSCPAGSLKDTDDEVVIELCQENWGGVGDTTSLIFGDGGYIDLCVTWIFVGEVCVKVLANGLAPWNYWVGADRAWNNFDCAIVLMSFEQVAAVLLGGGGGSTIRILRLFRLARLMKLVGKVPKLQSIVGGLAKGLSDRQRDSPLIRCYVSWGGGRRRSTSLLASLRLFPVTWALASS